jgi:secernin
MAGRLRPFTLPTMCDCLVALPAATGSVTYFAKNSDRPPNESQDVAWYPPRTDRGPLRVTHIEIEPFAGETLGAVLSRPRWSWGAEHGVNEAAVAVGNEAIYTTLDPRLAAPALTGMDLVRLALERATTSADAVEVIVELLEKYGQGGSGHDPASGPARPYWSSFLVADPATGFVLETSGREWAVQPVERSAAISNRTTIPGFDAAHRHPRQPVATRVDPRWHASRQLLADEPVHLAAIFEHLRGHGPAGEPGWTVCMHVDAVEATTASMVAELPSGGRPPRAWLLLGHPCRSIYVPVTVGEPFVGVGWERFATLPDVRSESLVALEAWLAAECPPAADAWRMVDAELGGTDPPSRPA